MKRSLKATTAAVLSLTVLAPLTPAFGLDNFASHTLSAHTASTAPASPAGWVFNQDGWRYADPITGQFAQGWRYLEDHWYFFDADRDGVMHVGWLYDGDNW